MFVGSGVVVLCAPVNVPFRPCLFVRQKDIINRPRFKLKLHRKQDIVIIY